MADLEGIIVLYAIMTGFCAGVSVCMLLYSAYKWYHGRRAKKMAEIVSIKEYLN